MLVLGIGYLAGVPLPALPSSLTEYLWDILKLQKRLIPGPRDGDLSHAGSAGMQAWASARCSSALRCCLWKYPEPGLHVASHCFLALTTFCNLIPKTQPCIFSDECVGEQLTGFRFTLSQLRIHRWQYSSIFKEMKLEVDSFWKFGIKM